MKVVIYNETIFSGGIEKCIEMLICYFNKKCDFEIVYLDEKKIDINIVNNLKKYAKVHKLEDNQIIEADICIWCRLYMDYDKLKKQIKANKYYLWVHSKPRERENCLLDDKEFLDTLDGIICVSNTMREMLDVDEKSCVIHNFLPQNIKSLADEEFEDEVFKDKTKLKLITVSRLSSGKGFERISRLLKMLKQNKIDFEYIIIGKGRAKEKEIKDELSVYKEVKFLGYKENPYPYIKKADYLVQLSDFESWGNVITESKMLGTPVIVTNFKTANEQVIDNVNGILIDLEEKEYTKYLNKIIDNKSLYRKNLECFEYQNETHNWNDIFNIK